MSNAINTLNVKASFSKKEVRALATDLKIPEFELELALANINKTLIGKEMVIDTLYHIAITTNTDDTGCIYTPDQLVADIVKKAYTPTFNGATLNGILKEVWTAVSPTLHQYPKGHALIKSLIVELNIKLGSKSSTGVKQVRDTVKLKALELYSQL